MALNTRCTRCMTSAKSNSAAAARSPNSRARRTWSSSLAERRIALLGTQPVFRQSPPISAFSISVTLALTAAAMYAVTRPAEPPPITIRLRSNDFGFAPGIDSLHDFARDQREQADQHERSDQHRRQDVARRRNLGELGA